MFRLSQHPKRAPAPESQDTGSHQLFGMSRVKPKRILLSTATLCYPRGDMNSTHMTAGPVDVAKRSKRGHGCDWRTTAQTNCSSWALGSAKNVTLEQVCVASCWVHDAVPNAALATSTIHLGVLLSSGGRSWQHRVLLPCQYLLQGLSKISVPFPPSLDRTSSPPLIDNRLNEHVSQQG